MKVVISSGHGLYVRGASGALDEVDEARKVVEALAIELAARDVEVITYHDDVSRSQSENLNRIVAFHNDQGPHDYDFSVHFNAYVETTKPMGTEVLYVTQQALAAELSAAIASAGHFINRGGKKRTDLAFLNGTIEKSCLLEICFVDSDTDARLYDEHFSAICSAIADVIGGDEEGGEIELPADEALFRATGKMSYFGGPEDTGVSASEGLAFISSVDQAPQLFLPTQPEGTTGLARRLNPFVNYIACRWDYNVTPKAMLAESGDRALVRSLATGREALAFPADWGPHQDTDRIADLSPGLCEVLDLETDDEVEVIYPWTE